MSIKAEICIHGVPRSVVVYRDNNLDHVLPILQRMDPDRVTITAISSALGETEVIWHSGYFGSFTRFVYMIHDGQIKVFQRPDSYWKALDEKRDLPYQAKLDRFNLIRAVEFCPAPPAPRWRIQALRGSIACALVGSLLVMLKTAFSGGL